MSTLASCDCCGQRMPLSFSLFAGMDTWACEWCRGRGDDVIERMTDALNAEPSDARECGQPEVCLGGRCYSPITCETFGFCRQRNFAMDRALTELERRHTVFMGQLPPANNALGRYIADKIGEAEK